MRCLSGLKGNFHEPFCGGWGAAMPSRLPDRSERQLMRLAADRLSVRWYLGYGLSYRDVEELLAERGIEVDHVIVFRWVQRFTPLLIDAARPCRHTPGDRWFTTRSMSRSLGDGSTSTERSTSSGRSST